MTLSHIPGPGTHGQRKHCPTVLCEPSNAGGSHEPHQARKDESKMNETSQATSTPCEPALTSVHSRYQLSGAIGSDREVIDFFQTFEEARIAAKTALVRGFSAPQIFDRHARKGAWQIWEVKPDGLYQVARR